MPATDGVVTPTNRVSAPASGLLATLCYQSRTPKQPNADDLDDLVADARERNRRFGVTGMLVHEGDRFFQWLEGPSAALDVLWTSISRDTRHEHVELLGEGVTPVRLFSDWDLRFHERNAQKAELTGDPLDERAIDASKDQSTLLAQLALSGDDDGISELVGGCGLAGEDPGFLCRALFEPAARQLGDWWCEDVCTSFDITVALGRLQSFVRRLDVSRPMLRRVAIERRSILVSPTPRETHMLGATLLGGFFDRAGWSVQAEFPQDDPALMSLVSTHWFDALALTLSDVFTRRDRLAALIQTIKDVRLVSRNPNMAVIVGGRAFTSSSDYVPELVGADVHYASAGQAVGDLDYWLFKHRISKEPRDEVSRSEKDPLTPLDIVRRVTPALALRATRGRD